VAKSKTNSDVRRDSMLTANLTEIIHGANMRAATHETKILDRARSVVQGAARPVKGSAQYVHVIQSVSVENVLKGLRKLSRSPASSEACQTDRNRERITLDVNRRGSLGLGREGFILSNKIRTTTGAHFIFINTKALRQPQWRWRCGSGR
jgi:uncharacterized protein (DUF2252 family)